MVAGTVVMLMVVQAGCKKNLHLPLAQKRQNGVNPAPGGRPWTDGLRTRSGPEGSSRSEFCSGHVFGLPPPEAAGLAFLRMTPSDDTPTPEDIPLPPIEEGGFFDAPLAPAPVAPPEPRKTAERSGPYRVLARKYRPQHFDDLIGQDATVRILRRAFQLGRVAHAFMLTGVRGVGKTTTARIIARALNCIGVDGQGGPTADLVVSVPIARRFSPIVTPTCWRWMPPRARA